MSGVRKNDPVFYGHEANAFEPVEPFSKEKLEGNLAHFFNNYVLYTLERDAEIYTNQPELDAPARFSLEIPECLIAPDDDVSHIFASEQFKQVTALPYVTAARLCSRLLDQEIYLETDLDLSLVINHE